MSAIRKFDCMMIIFTMCCIWAMGCLVAEIIKDYYNQVYGIGAESKEIIKAKKIIYTGTGIAMIMSAILLWIITGKLI